jgi:hypothetical protein
MRGYVDPFAHRARREGPDPETDEEDTEGLEAIERDMERGRREAPLAGEPTPRADSQRHA